MSIQECPRCGEHKLELMKSYSFCWECGYSASTEKRPTSALKRFGQWIGRQMDEGRRISQLVDEQKRIHEERVERIRALGF